MFNSLNVAQSGLKVSQVQVENVMNNIANEGTNGYKKRDVNVGELAINDTRETGRGAVVQDVTRNTSVYMYQNLITEESKNSALDELNIMLEDIESIFYETDDSGLSADLNRYFTSVENLRTSPNNEIYKNDIKNNANTLIDTLKTLYSEIEQREATTLGNAKDTVSEINGLLSDIGDISFDIANSTIVQHDLLDKRDALEKELSEYIDVDISREDSYTLSIGGVVAVRHDNNVRDLQVVEDYQAQRDVYTDPTQSGYISSIVDPAAGTWDSDDQDQEEQLINVIGNATGQVNFLGTFVAGSISGDTADQTVERIVADKAAVIANWNTVYPDREINDIVKSAAGALQIIYEDTEGDVPIIAETSSEGITFITSYETTKGIADSVTYTLNNELSVTLTVGEVLSNAIDTNADGVGDTDLTVDATNIVQALTFKINEDPEMSKHITAYNGSYTFDNNGNKVLRQPTNAEYYLVVESNTKGETGAFTGEITVNDKDAGYTVDDDGNPTTAEVYTQRTPIQKNELISKDAIDDIHLEIYEAEIPIESGRLKSMIDNLKTDSGNNLFAEYKERLDQFAYALSDLSSGYIEKDDGTYVYGLDKITYSDDYDKKIEIGLFTGSSISSLAFNNSMVNTLDQNKLDYLADLQWKENIDFDGTGENLTSFYSFYQELRINIADDRENIRFRNESQSAVTESLQHNYDKLTKVDKDEEMIELIKYQAAYEANAKMITVVDEMLATILGLKN
ncbi:MAG: flagellar basal body rod C-terminal domain-containing protein [Campylobacterota bacterium]|nr:flagellar basal body rod C-terminal domain-containing protein [Campylobacterota bacterium]